MTICGTPHPRQSLFAIQGSDLQNDIVFDEPWQAQAFAVTVLLHEAGRFTWRQWVDVFAKHIEAHPQRPGEAERTAYYRQWLSALEELLDELSLTGLDDRVAYKEDWRRSYLATEHGSAVEFQRNLPESLDHDHDHDHSHSATHPRPLFVSPAVQQNAGT